MKSAGGEQKRSLGRSDYLAWVAWPVGVLVAFLVSGLALEWGKGLLPNDIRILPVLMTLGATVIMFGIVMALLIIVPRVAVDRKTSRSDVGLARSMQWKDIGLAIAGFVLYAILSMIVMALVKQYVPGIDLNQQQDLGVEKLFGQDRLVGFLLFVLLAPVVEEVIFRGLLFSRLREHAMPLWLALFVVSALFALLHGQWNVALDVFMMSIVSCTLRVATGSVWASILLHMIKNMLAFYIVFVGLA